MNAIIDRTLRGEATPEELERLAGWRRASLRNERRYRQTVRLLEAARALGVGSAGARTPTAAELLAGSGAARARAVRRVAARAWLSWGVAAAAVLAFVFFHLRGAPDPGVLVRGEAVVRTGSSELSTVELDDGSVVRLGPSSRLRVALREDVREVSLDGRAFFAVAPDPGRPFRIRTQAGDAEVRGTRFEMSTREDSLWLVVVEGRVALSAGGEDVEVRGGEVGGIARGSVLRPRRVEDADGALEWVGKFLVFQSTPLRDAIREVEREYGVRVDIADPELAERTVTATFTNQSLAEVLDVLCSVVGARCTTDRDRITVSH